MPHRSPRELERLFDDLDLETSDVPPESGPVEFHYVQVGDDIDPATSGLYRWNGKQGVYQNDAGHTLPRSAAPDGFEFTVEWGGA